MNNFIRFSASSVLLLQSIGGYAADVTIPSGTDLDISITGEYGHDVIYQPGDTLILPEGNTVSGSGSVSDVLDIDINNQRSDSDTTYIETNIIINGDVIGGSKNGLEIRDSSTGGDHRDILKGNIIINGRVQGDNSYAFDMDVAQEGNIIINGIVEGQNDAIDLANKDTAMVGSITNNGKIISSTGIGIDSSGAITGGIYNFGLINAVRALRFYTENQSSQITNYVRNYSEINGNITSAYNHHAYIINYGKITGDILFDNDIGFYDDDGPDDDGDGELDSGNINGINTLENYGSVNSAIIEAIIKNNGQINVGSTELLGDSYNNKNLTNTTELNIGAHTFTNNGRLSVRLVTGSGVINNLGLIYVDKGATLTSGALNNIGGTVEVNFGSDFTGTGFTANTITFNDQSKITLDFDKSVFNTVQSGTVNIMTATSYGGEKVTLERGGLFFEVSDPVYDATNNRISADIEVLSPQSVVEKHTDGAANEILFVTRMLSEEGAHSTIAEEYGSIYDISSPDQLSTYIDNIMPASKDTHNQVVGTLSSLAFEQINQRSSSLASGISTGDAPDSFQFWIKGLHGNGDHDQTASTAGFDFEIDGFTLGLDKNSGEHTTGFMLNIGNTQVTSKRDETESITTYSAGIYDIWQRKALYLNAGMSFGMSDHDVARLKGAAQMKGSYLSSYIDMNLQGGYSYALPGIQLDPMFKLSGRWLNADGYNLRNETGSLTEQHGYHSVKQFEIGVGGAISKRWTFRGWMIEPKLSLMYVTDLAKDEKEQKITFLGNDYTGLQTDKEHSHLLTNVDIKLNRAENFDVILSYQLRTNKVSSYDAFSGRLNFNF